MILPIVHWGFYKDSSKLWQWRKFEGGKVVAVSGDGFSSRKACVQSAVDRGYIAPLTEPLRPRVLA